MNRTQEGFSVIEANLWVSLRAVLTRLCIAAPAVLAAVSGYCLFLIIVPFFLLNVHKAKAWDLICGNIDYSQQMGFAWLGAVLVLWARYLTSFLWVLSLIGFTIRRRLWVLVVLALAPLPIIYCFSGPYAKQIFDWIAPE